MIIRMKIKDITILKIRNLMLKKFVLNKNSKIKVQDLNVKNNY